MINIYLILSIFIGAVLVVDGLILRKSGGKFGGHPILVITTSIEFLWAIVSIVALFQLEFPGWLIFMPSLYVAHNVFGWSYALFNQSRVEVKATNSNIIIPMWYVNFGLLVGVVFGLSSLVAVGT